MACISLFLTFVERRRLVAESAYTSVFLRFAECHVSQCPVKLARLVPTVVYFLSSHIFRRRISSLVFSVGNYTRK